MRCPAEMVGTLSVTGMAPSGRWRTKDIDSTLEIGAVLDRDSGGVDVAFKACTHPKNKAPGGLDVAFRRAVQNHLTRLDIRGGHSTRANREASVHFYLPFAMAIQMHLLATCQGALNSHRLTNDRRDRNRATSRIKERIFFFAHKHLSQQGELVICNSLIGESSRTLTIRARLSVLPSAPPCGMITVSPRYVRAIEVEDFCAFCFVTLATDSSRQCVPRRVRCPWSFRAAAIPRRVKPRRRRFRISASATRPEQRPRLGQVILEIYSAADACGAL